MKKILFICFLFSTIVSTAQEKVFFSLQPDGTFLTEKDSSKYAVVEFEGKTKEELYKRLLSNINSLYKEPQKVLNTVENISINIRGYNKTITIDKSPLNGETNYSGYYNLIFKLKDGKVRIDAPIIEEDIYYTLVDKTKFAYVANSFFKAGKVKPKKKTYKTLTEAQLNVIINKILGFGDDQNEDW